MDLPYLQQMRILILFLGIKGRVGRLTKAIWIQESGKFLLVEFGSHCIFAVKSTILGFGIRNTAQGMRNPTSDCDTVSMFH